MIIIIDGQPLAGSGIGGDNLEEILMELREHHLPADRVVGEVRLNGKSYSEDMPHAALEVTRGSIENLELITRTGEEIALHFLTHGSSVVTDLLASVPKITELFRLGDEEEANEHFLRFLETLQLLMGMLDGAGRTLGVSMLRVVEGHGTMSESLEKTSNILSPIMGVQEQSDWAYLADMLEYELAPELETFRILLPRLTTAAH